MNTAHKGRRAEHRARAILEAAGYTVCRSAASKGVADLVAWNAVSFRLINVKSGTARAGPLERELLDAVPVPANCTKELWRFPTRARTPLIEVL